MRSHRLRCNWHLSPPPPPPPPFTWTSHRRRVSRPFSQAVVSSVTAGSLADVAGFKVGDVVLSMVSPKGQVEDKLDPAILKELEPGMVCTITIMRTVAAADPPPRRPPPPPPAPPAPAAEGGVAE